MTGLFIVARVGSTRLPEKHFIKAGDKTFIEWLVSRFLFSLQKEISASDVRIFIVTSDKPENKKFELLFSKNENVSIFYGSDSNIPLRQLQCAEVNNITEIISIDGDDILCSPYAAHEVRRYLLQLQPYVKSSGLPLGMNVAGYQTNFLRQALKNYEDASLETGWGRIFNETMVKDIQLGQYDGDKRLRMTLDYKEDSDFFKTVINSLQGKVLTMDDASLINFIIENKFYEINTHLDDIYWQNFDRQKKAES